MLATFAILVAFEFAFPVLDVQLSFNLCLIDAFSHVCNFSFKSLAFNRKSVHFLLELISKLLDFLVLLALFLLELTEALLLFQLGAYLDLERFEFEMFFLFIHHLSDKFNEIVFVLFDHLVVACNVWIFMQLTDQLNGALFKFICNTLILVKM
jgi:hypothetical protein